MPDLRDSPRRMEHGFLLQWPTLLTLAMFPVVVFAYRRLARAEDRDSIARFDDRYRQYMAHTPRFIPHVHADHTGTAAGFDPYVTTEGVLIMRSTLHVMSGARALITAAAAIAMLLAVAPVTRAADDPATLAQTYAKQAADLRVSAEKHLAEAKTHKAGAGPSKMQHESIAKHCEAIAKNLNAAAAESDALAQTYRGLAEQK